MHDHSIARRRYDPLEAPLCSWRVDGIADGRRVTIVTSINPCSGGNSRRLFITMCSHSVLLLMVTHYLPTPSPVRALSHIHSHSHTLNSSHSDVCSQLQPAPEPGKTCARPAPRRRGAMSKTGRTMSSVGGAKPPIWPNHSQPPSAARIRK